MSKEKQLEKTSGKAIQTSYMTGLMMMRSENPAGFLNPFDATLEAAESGLKHTETLIP